MEMLFKAFFLKSLSTAYIAEVALSASIPVNHARHKRFWELILEGEAGGQSSGSFVNNPKVAKWHNLSKTSYQLIFCFPRISSKER